MVDYYVENKMTFALKYRPRNFKQVIGHEAVVTRLRGIVSKLQKDEDTKNAILFLGPSSAGKTTLARCLAAEVNGLKDAEGHPDYIEKNAGSDKGIDDVRAWVAMARYKPRTKKRFIVIDEAQALLSNKQAAQAILKPLEEPAKDTIWVLCSMDPAKFATGDGRAIANRCTQFNLEPHSPKELLKQAVRIATKEEMHYVLDDDRAALKAVVRNCNNEMRTVANMVESLQEYYEGLEKKPKVLGKEHVGEVLSSTESSDDLLAAEILYGVYGGSFAVVQKGLLKATDGFGLINKLLWANAYLMNITVLNGERSNKVWPSQAAKKLQEMLKRKDVLEGKVLRVVAAVNECLVLTKAQAQAFATSPEELLSAKLYRCIKEIHPKG